MVEAKYNPQGRKDNYFGMQPEAVYKLNQRVYEFLHAGTEVRDATKIRRIEDASRTRAVRNASRTRRRIERSLRMEELEPRIAP